MYETQLKDWLRKLPRDQNNQELEEIFKNWKKLQQENL